MELGKKVFLLSLLLLLLIVSCVYKHTKEFVNVVPIVIEEKVIVEEPVEDKTNIENPIIEETIIENEEKEESTNEVVSLQIEPNDEISKEVNASVSEKITKIEEEIKEPKEVILKRIDEGYRRSNGELFYIDLSSNTKKIQDNLYTLMKNEPFEFTKNGIDYINKNDEMLAKIVKIMNENKNLKFEIAGHVSIKPDEEKYNTYISVMRAANIKKKLISLGISKNRMKARGYGDKIPLAQDDIKLFNRIEFNIIGE